jgi:hypothetical protein
VSYLIQIPRTIPAQVNRCRRFQAPPAPQAPVPVRYVCVRQDPCEAAHLAGVFAFVCRDDSRANSRA